jgi:tetratricopeptide (TPR) repeat protein
MTLVQRLGVGVAVAGLSILPVALGAAPSQAPSADTEALKREALAANQRVGALAQAGRLDEAIDVAKRGLALTEKAFGPAHANVSADLITLANLYQRQGDYFSAEPLVMRAVDIDTKLYGPQHPEVAVDLGAVALLLQLKGEYASADQKYQQALTMLASTREERYQPYVTEFRKGRGDALVRGGRLREGLAQWDQAAGVFERTNPPRARRLLIDMAEVARQLGDQVAADRYLQRARGESGQ